MNFRLSPELDENKVFLVQHSDLEGRFDPHFHKPKFREIENRINSCNWHISKLKDLFKINRGGSPRPIQRYLTEGDEGSNWIKIGDTKGVDKYIRKTKQKISPEGTKYSRQVFEGDFILSNSMSFGKPFIMKITGYIHDGWLLFRNVTDGATKDYLHILLGSSFVYELFKKQTIGGVVENLNIDLVKNIKLPIPPKKIQNEIVAKMDVAYADKKYKETEAQRFLDSIDDYLLGELGIELPNKEENNIQSRIFTRRLSEVSGGRFDPDYFQNRYRELQVSLQSGCFKCRSIKEVTHFVANGNTPASGEYSDVATDFSIIKVRSYEGISISLKNLDFVKSRHGQQAKQNDIFILSAAHQSSYVGRFLKLLNDVPTKNTSFVGELICIRSNPSICNAMYLFSLLNIEPYKVLLNREKTGQTSHIYPKDIKHIKIPVPPLAKQIEIANHITEIHNQAKALQQQAKSDLDQAKKEVEEIILGTDESKA